MRAVLKMAHKRAKHIAPLRREDQPGLLRAAVQEQTDLPDGNAPSPSSLEEHGCDAEDPIVPPEDEGEQSPVSAKMLPPRADPVVGQKEMVGGALPQKGIPGPPQVLQLLDRADARDRDGAIPAGIRTGRPVPIGHWPPDDVGEGVGDAGSARHVGCIRAHSGWSRWVSWLPETWNKEACSESAWPLVRERGRVMGLCHAPAGSGWINLLLCLNDANLPHEKSPGRAPRFG